MIGDVRAFNRRGFAVTGLHIGVLHVESRFPLLDGHLQNAASLGVPVCYECVSGVTPRQIVACDPDAERPLVEAARRLEKRGVGAIIGTCGSFANYHSALVAAVDIPVFSSVLLCVPLLLQTIGAGKKLLIVFASSSSFTDRLVAEAAITDQSRLAIADCLGLPAFESILENRQTLDSDRLREQLVALIEAELDAQPSICQILFQCSELAPYAQHVRDRYGLPVFDVTELARWVHRSLGA